MNKEIKTMTSTCTRCQKAKIIKHNRAVLQNFNLPDKRFEHINIDLIGPLPIPNNFRYCLTCINRYSRWPTAIPINDMSAETVAKALTNGWISQFGLLNYITTDQGRQFESNLFRELNQLCGNKYYRTTAYHPQSNRIIERFHRTLKTALKTYEANNWSEQLPLI